jgi:hypothetical protein
MSPEEKLYCEYVKGNSCGSFHLFLIKAIEHSDEHNEKLLSKSYPELVKVIKNVKYKSGYLSKLKEKWNEIYRGNKFEL